LTESVGESEGVETALVGDLSAADNGGIDVEIEEKIGFEV